MGEQDFARAAIAVALKDMWKGHRFSICVVRDALDALGLREGPAMKSLELLHCIKWCDMPPGMPEQVMREVLAMLNQPPMGDCIDTALQSGDGSKALPAPSVPLAFSASEGATDPAAAAVEQMKVGLEGAMREAVDAALREKDSAFEAQCDIIVSAVLEADEKRRQKRGIFARLLGV